MHFGFAIWFEHPERRTGRPVGFVTAATSVLLGEFGGGQGLPELLRAGANEEGVDELWFVHRMSPWLFGPIAGWGQLQCRHVHHPGTPVVPARCTWI